MSNNLLEHFCIVGLKDLKPLFKQNDEKDKVITELEVVYGDNPVKYTTGLEEYLDLDGTGTIWLKITFLPFEQVFNERPMLTAINFFWMPTGQDGSLMIPAKEQWCPVPIRDLETNRLEHKLASMTARCATYQGNYDLARLFKMNPRQGYQLVLCYKASMQPKESPLSDIRLEVSRVSPKTPGAKGTVLFNLPPGYTILKLVLGKEENRALSWKSRPDPLNMAFAPEELDIYPRVSTQRDIVGAIPSFCFPEGVKILREQFTPTSFSFVLTNQDNNRVYVTSLCFYEQAEQNIVNQLHCVEVSEMKKLYVPKSICLVSMWPFVDKFKEVLKQLYRIHLSTQQMPIERVVGHLINDVPLPGPGDYSIQYEIGNQTISFSRPSLLRPSYVPLEALEVLFRTLSIDKVLELWSCAMLERKILLISKHAALLNQIALAITALMFPFKWINVLIPILPVTLREYMGAPVPFIIGVAPDFLAGDQADFPSEAALVYLDENRIVTLEAIPPLPSKHAKILKHRLEPYAKLWRRNDSRIETIDEAFNIQIHEDEDNGDYFQPFDVMDAFFQFMIGILKNYHKYIAQDVEVDKSGKKKKVIYNDALDAFHVTAYLKSQDSNKIGSFLYKLVETGHFARFIESRLYMSADGDLRYFDDCLNIKKPKRGQFISKESLELQPLAIGQPNHEDLPEDALFRYETFPVLDERYLPQVLAEKATRVDNRQSLGSPSGNVSEESSGAANLSATTANSRLQSDYQPVGPSLSLYICCL